MYIALSTDNTDLAEMYRVYARKKWRRLCLAPCLVSSWFEFAYSEKRKSVLLNMAGGVDCTELSISLRFI